MKKVKEEVKDVDTIALTVESVNQILGYLATRPYNEVAQLINEIQKQAQ
jgi:hypothetical protein